MQFHALLALTLAASASATLSARNTLVSRELDECARECTTDYLVSDAYKTTTCDIKKDPACSCTDKGFLKNIAACLQTNCTDLVDSTREENITDCKEIKLEFDTDAYDAGVAAGKEAAKESASKSESSSASATSTKTSAASASATADDKTTAASASATTDDKTTAASATTTAASEDAEEEKEDEDSAASRGTLGMMGVLVAAAVAGVFVV